MSPFKGLGGLCCVPFCTDTLRWLILPTRLLALDVHRATQGHVGIGDRQARTDTCLPGTVWPDTREVLPISGSRVLLMHPLDAFFLPPDDDAAQPSHRHALSGSPALLAALEHVSDAVFALDRD